MSESSRKDRISKMNTSQLKAYRSAAAERNVNLENIRKRKNLNQMSI